MTLEEFEQYNLQQASKQAQDDEQDQLMELEESAVWV